MEKSVTEEWFVLEVAGVGGEGRCVGREIQV